MYRQPDRQKQIRKKNIVQFWLRNDRVFRREAVLKIVGMELLPKLLERKYQLAALSGKVEKT